MEWDSEIVPHSMFPLGAQACPASDVDVYGGKATAEPQKDSCGGVYGMVR